MKHGVLTIQKLFSGRLNLVLAHGVHDPDPDPEGKLFPSGGHVDNAAELQQEETADI